MLQWRAHSGAWLEQCAGMGNLFGSLDPHDLAKVNQSIQTLVDYVKTLQANYNSGGQGIGRKEARRSLDR
jgi:cytochrome c556